MARRSYSLNNLPEDLRPHVEAYQWMRDHNYNDLRKRQEEHEKLYELNFDLKLDTNNFKSQTRLPTAFDIVEAASNHIAMDHVALKVKPNKGKRGLETNTTKVEAETKETWGQRLLDMWGQIQPYYVREFVKNLSYRGEAYFKVGIEAEFLQWWKTTTKDEAYEGLPFFLQVPDAMNVMSSLDMQDGCMPYEVFEEKVVTLRQVREMLREFNTDGWSDIFGNLSDSQLVTLVEWTTPASRGYFAADNTSRSYDVVRIEGESQQPNVLGFVPYVRGFSGYGKMPRDGNPARLAVGILSGVSSTIVLQSRLVNILDTAVAKHALPTPVMTVPDGVDVKGPVDLSPGTVFVEENGIKLRFELPPTLPPALMALWDKVEKALESFMPGVVQGQARGGEAAISLTTRLNQAGLKWESQYITTKSSIAKVMEIVFRMVEQFDRSIDLGDVALSPEGAKDTRCEVKIRPGNPDELRYDMVLGMQLERKWPKERIVQDMYHQEDALQFMADLEADKQLDENPILRELIARKIMERVLTAEELAAYEEGRQTAQPGVAGTVQPPRNPGSLPGVGGSPRMGVPALPQQEMPPVGRATGVTP